MFLGTSEGVGSFDDLFGVVDRKAKLYQRKDSVLGLQRTLGNRMLPSLSAVSAALPRSNIKNLFPVKLPLRELTEQALLHQLAPTAALVNGRGDILYLHGRSGMYLEPSPGESGVNNILKMAREGLRPALSSALHKVMSSGQTEQTTAIRVKTNGHYSLVDLSISPVSSTLDVSLESPLFLVVLEEGRGADPQAGSISTTSGAADARGATPESEHEARIAALTQELRAKDEYLQSTHEELESSTEELKSSNEEMQSVNEELQSTNEELETSKEELQSVNEELATVNTELQSKVTDLSRSNDDMSNLLAGTGIGTVFVDHQLRILRFTPAASAIINLIATDVGRPVAHIVSNLVGYSSLLNDLRAVLQSLIPKEVDVQAADGKWYTLRIQPYRTLDNVIEGAVISFIDITEMVRVRDALVKTNDQLRLAVVLRDASDAMTVQDLEGRMIAWNPAAERLYGWSEAQALAMNARERIPDNLREGALEQLSRLSRAEVLLPYHTQRLSAAGTVLEVSIISSALLTPTGQMYAIATTERAQAVRPA